MFRASHRKEYHPPPPQDPRCKSSLPGEPFHSYTQADAQKTPAGAAVLCRFQMMATAYCFAKVLLHRLERPSSWSTASLSTQPTCASVCLCLVPVLLLRHGASVLLGKKLCGPQHVYIQRGSCVLIRLFLCLSICANLCICLSLCEWCVCLSVSLCVFGQNKLYFA